MQDYFRSPRIFSQRTDALAEKLQVFLKELPDIIGISERMMFGYRSGKYPVTAKALRKLEAAERAAGIGPPGGGNTLNEDFVEYQQHPPPQKNDPFSDPRWQAVQDQLAALRDRIETATGDLSLADLIERMTAAGAWPPSAEDRKLTPGQLLSKYPPGSRPKTSYKARGKSA